MSIHICPICGRGTSLRVEAIADLVSPTRDLGRRGMHRCSKAALRRIELANRAAEEDGPADDEPDLAHKLCDGFALMENTGADPFRSCDCD